MMSRTQRTITVALWAIVVVGMLGLLGLLAAERRQTRAAEAKQAVLIEQAMTSGTVLERNADGTFAPATQHVAGYTFPSPTFTLVDQNNQPFDASQLRGKVWTAMFFFSQCTGVCPSMTEKIETLMTATPDARVHCVSFTADPTRDTPERLKKYAQATKADESRWHLLTGTYDQMKAVAAGFRLPFDKPTDHSPKIMLVGPDGVVRDYYNSQDEAQMARLASDVKALLAESSSTTRPTVAAR